MSGWMNSQWMDGPMSVGRPFAAHRRLPPLTLTLTLALSLSLSLRSTLRFTTTHTAALHLRSYVMDDAPAAAAAAGNDAVMHASLAHPFTRSPAHD